MKAYQTRDAEHRAEGITPGHPLAPPDTLRRRWLVLKRRGCSDKQLAALHSKGQGRPRGISPPFFLEESLVSEYKWFGFPDSVFDTVTFEEVSLLFGMDIPFLDWVSEMLSTSSEPVISALEQLVTICSVPYPTPTLPYPNPDPVSARLHTNKATPWLWCLARCGSRLLQH